MNRPFNRPSSRLLKSNRRRKSSRRLMLESMEERQLLAVLLSTDFNGRTVTGNTASNITWTTDGVADPGDLTAVEDTQEPAVQLGGLFDTASTNSHFAPDLNTDNEDNWSVDIPLVITAPSVSIDNVSLDGDHFNNSGANQSAGRDTDFVVTISGSTSGQVATEVMNSGSVTTDWTLAFFGAMAPIELSNSETWTMTIGTTNFPNNSGNNSGLDGITVNGTVAADPILLSTDFDGRTVSGNVASNITWVTDGIADPGDLTAVEGTEEAPVQLAGLFDTANNSSQFAPDLNTDNEDNWSVSIPLVLTAPGVSVDGVVIDGDHLNNAGANQTAGRDTDIVVSLTGSTSGEVATETLGSGSVTTDWELTFFETDPSIVLSNSETWTLTIGTTNFPNTLGNNFGLDGIAVLGTTISAPLDAVDDTYTTPITEDQTLTVPDGATDILANDSGSPMNIIESDPLSANGAAVAVSANGSFVYDPSASTAIQSLNVGDSLTDTFTYTISDIVPGGAGSMSVGSTVEVSTNHTTFDLSVFPGKAGFDDGVDSGTFGDGTVLDYRFFHSPGNTLTTYADGGGGFLNMPTATNSNGNGESWANVWTTNDPGTNFSGGDAANVADPTNTFARSQGIEGTIDISTLASGTLDFIYGSFFDRNTITLTMSGANQPDVVVQHVEDPPNDVNRGFITSFSFADAEQYSTITYTYANADVDASRARFMGVILDGLAAPGGIDTATVSVVVNGVNDAPVGVDDSGAVTESVDVIANPTASGNVVTNDTDVDNTNAELSVTAVGGDAAGVGNSVVGTYGSVVINGDGSFTYTLDDADPDTQALSRGEKATDTFTYTVGDGADTGTASLVIDIAGANDAPVAAAATASVTEDSSISDTGTVIDASTDVDSSGVVLLDVEGNGIGTNTNVAGTNGTLVISDDGSYTYNLDNAAAQSLSATDTLTETFTYTISESGTVAPVVEFDNTVEVYASAAAFNLSVFPGKAGFDDGVDSGTFGDGTVVDYRFFHSPGNVLTSYADGGAGVVSMATATNSNGNGEDWANVWTTNDPGTDFTGGDAANFVDPADDTFARSQGIDGTIDITNLAHGSLYFVHGSFRDRYTFDLTMSGPGQADMTIQHTLDPPETNNRAWITQFNFDDALLYDTISYTYTNADTDGSRARFMGVIVDGGGLETDTGDLTVTVSGSNDPVTANNDGGEITELQGPENGASVIVGTAIGVAFGDAPNITNTPNTLDTADSDIDTNDTLTVQNAGSLEGTYGTAVVDVDGDYTYTLGATPAQETALNGVDAGTDVTETFTLTITDSQGSTADSDLVFTIHGATDNRLPVITQGDAPLSVTMDEDGAPTAFVAPAVDATDADAGDTLTWSVATGGEATNGTATVTGTGASPTISYSPNANFNGSDSFTVQVSDGAATDTIVVDVTIAAINDPATFSGDISGTGVEAGAAITGTLLAEDAIDGMTTPNYTVISGTATIDPVTGVWSYDPLAAGTDTFIVQVTDDQGHNETQEITIDVDSLTPVFQDAAGDVIVNAGDGEPHRIIIQQAGDNEVFVRLDDERYGSFVVAESAVVRVNGGDGDDRISVTNCIDTEIYAGAGNDQINGGPCNDVVYGEDGRDLILLGEGDNWADGGGGNDHITARGGMDVIHGGGGNDSLIGGAASDSLYGGIGNDRISGGTGPDLLVGGLGNDRIWAGAGADVLIGGLGNDNLRGGTGDDLIVGGEGSDHLHGERGADWIHGGTASLENDDVAQQETLLNWSISRIASDLGSYDDDGTTDGLNGGGGIDQMLIGTDDVDNSRNNDIVTTL